ncbi:MAG: hypothetical protein ACRESZ_02200 [Methylococcales bacterium]
MAGLSMSHVKEIVYRKFTAFQCVDEDTPISLYSAGLGQKGLDGQIVFAGVQSLVRAPMEEVKDPQVIVIDEAQLCGPILFQ